jgi:hypothetical protein
MEPDSPKARSSRATAAEPAYMGEGVRVPDEARTERLFDTPTRDVARRRLPTDIESSFRPNDSQGTGFEALYPPPLDMMSDLTLEELKLEAETHDQWIMLNVQDPKVLKSLELNADLWADSLIKSVIQGSFQFAQRSLPSIDAVQLQSSYNLLLLPAIIIIDPNTGQKMHEWTGLPDKETFMESLIPFMDTPPSSPASAALVNSAVKRSSFQNATPKPTGSKGIAGVSVEDEALHEAIAASLVHGTGNVPLASPELVSEGGCAHRSSPACGDNAHAEEQPSVPAKVSTEQDKSCTVSANASAPGASAEEEEAMNAAPMDGKTIQEQAQVRLNRRSGLSELQCRVALQLPNTRLIHSFSPDDTLQSVYDLVIVSLPEDEAAMPFRLIGAGKESSALSKMSSTVEDAGLQGALVRLVWE